MNRGGSTDDGASGGSIASVALSAYAKQLGADGTAPADQSDRLETAAQYGASVATQTGTPEMRDLKRVLENIDAVRAAADDLFDDGGRLASNGGSGIYSGGEYDNFRRSENVEDRRKQKYSKSPSTVTKDSKIPVEVGMRNFTDDLLRGTTNLSQKLGINDIK